MERCNVLGRCGGWKWLIDMSVMVACLFVLDGVALGASNRVLEQVSPSYKGGYGAGTLRMVSANGEKAAFDSLGVFGGVQWDSLANGYLAERVEGVGWTTTSLQPPPIGELDNYSSGLEYVLATLDPGKTSGEAQRAGTQYGLHSTDLPNISANWEIFGGMTLLAVDGKPFFGESVGESGDLCHLVLGYAASGALLPEAEKTEGQIYDMSRNCDGSTAGLRLVGVDNAGNIIDLKCGVDLGAGPTYAESAASGGDPQESTFNTMTSDGRMIFFTTSVGNAGCKTHQVFARLDGEHTVEVSKPLAEACGEVPCGGALIRASANFKGASEDGSDVYFTTRAPLVAGDKDVGNDLYLAKMGCGEGEPDCGVSERQVVSLGQVSQDAVVGQSAEVVSVLRIASDGSRAYFVARGVLSQDPNAEGGAPVNGANNLYVYDADSERTTFVADLCSGPILSGSVEDVACPVDLSSEFGATRSDSRLWSGVQEVQSTRDGRVLVFASYGRLTEDDADSAKDIYRYDSVTELLDRISVGEGGYDANGNDESDATITPGGIGVGNTAAQRLELGSRVVTDDGSQVVFSAAGPLSPRAVNGLLNIYEWHSDQSSVVGGAVSLLSGGASLTDDESATISPSGRDVFFVTAEGLAEGDEDGLRDIYDARVGGGFRDVVKPRQPCSGDACQGPLTTPVPLLVPGSAVQEAGEDFPPPSKRKTVKKAMKSKKVKNKAGKRHRNARRARRSDRGTIR